ncbi:hypothetical protein Hdeb2414_s0023g00632241 [Helianthus debilis subsp. tardiflorus]
MRIPNENSRLVLTTFTGVVIGFFLGVSFPVVLLDKAYSIRLDFHYILTHFNLIML